MKKNFVLDTNVLLHDSNCLHNFDDNIVNIPIHVIEELDSFKRDQSELGRNSRRVAREIDSYRIRGSLESGVQLDNGGTIRVQVADGRNNVTFSRSHAMDNAILGCVIGLRESEPDVPLVFVTKDTNLRIRADALGIDSVDYEPERKDLSEVYDGTAELEVDVRLIDRLFDSGALAVDELPNGDQRSFELYPNQYLTLLTPNGKHNALARVNGDHLQPLRKLRQPIWGVLPRNREQHFALDMLMRDDVRLCTLIGKAGTGKTLLALAAGVELVIAKEQYRRMLVSRPIFPMGRDVGYLPGDLQEKMSPWMQPVRDNFEFLTSVNKSKDVRSYEELVAAGQLEVEALTYIRGRSLPGQFMLVDEAQNLTPHEIKTVLTRVGQGTKVVFTGDPYQIDQPYLDSINNGLTYLVERFKAEPIAGHVSLTKGERSELAELAANLL